MGRKPEDTLSNTHSTDRQTRKGKTLGTRRQTTSLLLHYSLLIQIRVDKIA